MSLDFSLYYEVEPDEEIEVYHGNITHNLGNMALHAGVYEALWRPEELGKSKADQIVPELRDGVAKLEAHPGTFKQFDSPNGWGMYDHFVPFCRKTLEACEKYPTATIRVSR